MNFFTWRNVNVFSYKILSIQVDAIFVYTKQGQNDVTFVSCPTLRYFHSQTKTAQVRTNYSKLKSSYEGFSFLSFLFRLCSLLEDAWIIS